MSENKEFFEEQKKEFVKEAIEMINYEIAQMQNPSYTKELLELKKSYFEMGKRITDLEMTIEIELLNSLTALKKRLKERIIHNTSISNISKPE